MTANLLTQHSSRERHSLGLETFFQNKYITIRVILRSRLSWPVKTISPCQSCGACCARFRVSYYWGENVPADYFEETNPMFRSLKSKNDLEGRPRCDALDGEIGTKVACGIYENRPTPCREFRYSYEDGGPKEIRCDEARSKFGLAPLLENG